MPCKQPCVALQFAYSTSEYCLLAQVALQLEKLLVQADIAEWDHSGLESNGGQEELCERISGHLVLEGLVAFQDCESEVGWKVPILCLCTPVDPSFCSRQPAIVAIASRPKFSEHLGADKTSLRVLVIRHGSSFRSLPTSSKHILAVKSL